MCDAIKLQEFKILMLSLPSLPLNTARPGSENSGSFPFLRKFFRYGVQAASAAPSSRRLALALCRQIDPTRPQMILELGAGTGAVTTVAVEHMHPQSDLLAVELNPDFAQVLRRRCPQAYVIEANVSTVCARLRALGLSQIDVVISELPIPSLPRSINQQVFTCLQQFADKATFSQLAVMPWVYLGLYRRLFHDVTFTPVWWNIPSGGVYHCRRLRDDFSARLPGKKD